MICKKGGIRKLSREEIITTLKEWNLAWENHDLDGVMRLYHDDIYFENWTGDTLKGKKPSERHGPLGLPIMAGFGLSAKTHLSMSGSRKFFIGGSSKVPVLKRAMKENWKKGEGLT